MRKLTATLAVFLTLILALACSPEVQTPQPDGPETPAEADPQALPSQGPVQIGREEVNARIRTYLTLAAWSDAAAMMAQEEPEHFRRAMLSSPNPECTNSFREQQVVNPELGPEVLLECITRSIRELEDQSWSTMSPDAREARTRRAYIMLSGAIDPPEYIAVNLAANRGIRVTSQNDENFAQLKLEYQPCHEAGQVQALRMITIDRPEEMAAQWLHDTQALQACFNNTTTRLYRESQAKAQAQAIREQAGEDTILDEHEHEEETSNDEP